MAFIFFFRKQVERFVTKERDLWGDQDIHRHFQADDKEVALYSGNVAFADL